MAWVMAIGAFVTGLLLMPAAIRAIKRSVSGKGRFGGAAMAFGLALLWVFDAPKAAAIENIQKKKSLADEGEAVGDEPEV